MGLLSNIFSNTRKPQGYWGRIIEGMHTYTPDELTKHLAAAGFKDITIHRNEPKHWLAVTTVK